MAAAIDRLEAATRELAVQRVAEALMRLDETSRMKVLAFSLKADGNGARMEGMLSIVANMKPAALARLLMLVAAQAPTDPRRVAAALPLPSDKARLLDQLLVPMRPTTTRSPRRSAPPRWRARWRSTKTRATSSARSRSPRRSSPPAGR